MFSELIEKLLGILNPTTNNEKHIHSYQRGKNVKNTTSPIEFKTNNVIYPDNRREKEIENLYTEIRELQAKNREKINKNRFVCL